MERAMFFADEFIVPPEIRGCSALIVDDVFRAPAKNELAFDNVSKTKIIRNW
jgi:hypothetical protein